MYGTPTWIWSVVVDDALYVQACNGQKSRWYHAALRQKAGRIAAAGMTIEVSFDPVGGPDSDNLQDRINDTYRAKHKDSPYLAPIIGTGARSATVRLLPR